MTEEDRRECIEAVHQMYALADLPAPKVIFVPSPLVGMMVAGCGSAILGGDSEVCHKINRAWDIHRDILWCAIREATWNSTFDAIWKATWDATWDAIGEPVRIATRGVDESWVVVPNIAQICNHIAGDVGLFNTREARYIYQQGYQVFDYHTMMEFYREVAQLDIDWTRWIPWMKLAKHGGPRWVHRDFVVISDFPEVLSIDDQNRPHAETGPFCRWSDGTSLYMWHGTRVPAWVLEHPERITVELIDAERNSEIRRCMLEKMGLQRYLSAAGSVVIDEDVDEGMQVMRLLKRNQAPDERPVERENTPLLALHLRNSTPDPDGSVREYIMRVPPNMTSVWEARNWTFGIEDPSVRFHNVS